MCRSGAGTVIALNDAQDLLRATQVVDMRLSDRPTLRIAEDQ